VTTLSQARTFVLVLILALVALGLLAVRSARRPTAPSVSTAAAVTSQSTPGAGAALRHQYRVALGR
jgi:multidrug efflux pump subunit AcrB